MPTFTADTKNHRHMESYEGQQPPTLTLEQFCEEITLVVNQSNITAWVTAEIAQLSINRGHYYIDLAQKSATSDSPLARLRCTIWSGESRVVLAPFRAATGGDIAAGMKILALVTAQFHPVYGISGHISDIDPKYTLGDLEARRRAILERLQAEGVADMNKALPMPTVVKSIAIVSSMTAAGYGDFINQLANNAYGITFRTQLFEAKVQGDDADASIVAALDRVAERGDEFDVAVIIRGGGSKMDLACFDSYDVATNIAQFPLPVITGIGHERDRSIADMVAHTSVKTPTAVAEFLIAHDADFLVLLDEFERRIVTAAGNELNANKTLIENLSIRLLSAAKESISDKRNTIEAMSRRAIMSASLALAGARQQLNSLEMRAAVAASRHIERDKSSLDHSHERLLQAARHAIQAQAAALDNYAQRVKAADPRSVLARGFSVTTDQDGKMLTSAKDAAPGDTIVTHLADGNLKSTVTK